MSPELFDSPLFLSAIALAVVGLVFALLGLAALLRWRPLSFVIRTLTGALLITLGALAGAVAIGIQGYRALTHEVVAARIVVQPGSSPQRFTATFHFPGGRTAKYEIAGDEIYVDAHILKWTSHANFIGLHTVYELDRVSGRYHALKDERGAERTVHALGPERPVDLFALRRRYAFLSSLLDAEYGSATFVPVTRPAELELRVSTSGLLLREVKARQWP